MTSIDVRQVNNQSMVQNPAVTNQGTATNNTSIYGNGFNNGTNTDTCEANQNGQTNSNNDIYARDEIKNLFTQYNINIEEAKAQNLIGQVLGKSEANITLDDDTVSKLAKIIELAIRTVKAKKLELNIEKIVNYGNMISTSVASGCKSFTLENIELDVIELENDKNKKFLKLEGLTDGNSNDVMSIDEQMAKFYCGKLYHIKDWNALPREEQEKYIEDFRNKSIEEKRKYIKQFFGGFFKKGAEKLQLDNYVRYINATKDPESRAALIDALETLLDENKYGAFKSWLTSFKTDDERNIAADAADSETMGRIFNSENVPEEDAKEAYRELTEIQNEEIAQKFENDRDKYKKEFFEKNSDTIEKIIELLNKKEEDLTDEDKQFLEEHKKVVVEYRNIVRGADKGRTIGLINSKVINDA
ncbi:MAG: hypothetical protein MJ231_09010, partial [bacterium]|nr:hypothetical protein [bacterium]